MFHSISHSATSLPSDPTTTIYPTSMERFIEVKMYEIIRMTKVVVLLLYVNIIKI